MLDFYSEISKYKKQPEPKKLRENIDRNKKDFIDIALNILKKTEKKGGY